PLGSSANYITAVPMDPENTSRFGFFRELNARIFHNYLNGKVYSELLYAPNDRSPYTVTEPWYDYAYEYVSILGTNGNPLWSSYCFSPAGMLDPLVLQAPSAGGYTNPYSFATGFRSPNVSQAKQPALKSRVMEHHWDQHALENPCNPAFTGDLYDGC